MKEDTSIASERVEAAVIEALHDGADDELRERLGLRLERVGGATVSVASKAPSIVLNRTLGLGLKEPATAATVARIASIYRDGRVERFFLHVHPEAGPDGIKELLTEANLEPYRRWMKFERRRRAVPDAESSLQVREIGRDQVGAFGRIAAAGFGMSEAVAPLFEGLVDRDGFHLYMSFDGDEPAGTGLLYVDGDCAWLDWAATDPKFRRRGSQRATLVRRIEDAIDAGCTRLMTCTGEAVDGDPQHSYHNIEWAGFKPKFLRENWIPG